MSAKLSSERPDIERVLRGAKAVSLCWKGPLDQSRQPLPTRQPSVSWSLHRPVDSLLIVWAMETADNQSLRDRADEDDQGTVARSQPRIGSVHAGKLSLWTS